jgi:O-antigen ligase
MQAHYHCRIIALQVVLFTLLLLSQTRAAVALTLVLQVYWLWRVKRDWFSTRHWKAALAVLIVLIVGGVALAGSRLTNLHYARTSIDYRISLQAAGLRASTKKPLLGYGVGNLADALACPALTAPSLQKTCDQGYYFNSSHNIFLDRVLAFGWLGGLAWIILILYRLFRTKREAPAEVLLSLCLLMICLYYFTNVTNIVLELLVWVLVLHASPSKTSLQGDGS